MKKKILACLAVFICLFLVYKGCEILILLYISKDELNAHGQDESYYKAIEQAVENNNTVALETIFDFEWDKVFLIPPYMNTDRLTQIAGVEVYPLDPHMDLFRMLFIKDNLVVYDFACTIGFLRIEPLGEIVLREDAVFELLRKYNPIVLFLQESS